MSLFEEVMRELRLIRERLKRVEALLEERLIGLEDPLPDEVGEVEGYEEEKAGRLELVYLEEVFGAKRVGQMHCQFCQENC